MHATAQHTATIRLGAGAEATYRGLARRVLRVREGAAWITQHHDVHDYIVAAGHEVHVAGHGPVIVHALADLAIDVLRPRAARRALAALAARVAARLRRTPSGDSAFPPATR